jgi:hypothetical protein
MKKLCFNIILSAAFAGLIACNSKPKNMTEDSGQTTTGQSSAESPNLDSVSMQAKQIAAEQEARNVAEVTFDEGSSELSESAKKQIASLLNTAKTEGQIEEVKVISWSDQAYPRQGQPELPKSQERIAEARNKSIQNFIRSQNKDVPVELHSMARRPSSVSKLWGSDDARIKKSLESAGISASGETEKTSQSIVMVVPEDHKE